MSMSGEHYDGRFMGVFKDTPQSRTKNQQLSMNPPILHPSSGCFFSGKIYERTLVFTTNYRRCSADFLEIFPPLLEIQWLWSILRWPCGDIQLWFLPIECHSMLKSCHRRWSWIRLQHSDSFFSSVSSKDRLEVCGPVHVPWIPKSPCGGARQLNHMFSSVTSLKAECLWMS